ncbi:hypothetical protein [Streptomyces sp. NPDC058739]|uniref:hypothetical protein n=1 Tax=Streptomyces sp. NPDC058739 TaxID=3346618 RepID=UPI0036A0E447
MTDPSRSDEDVLRRAFALIGEEAGRPEPRLEPEPGPVPLVPVRARTVWWRRRGVVLTAFASAAALCAGVVGAVLIGGGAAEPGAADRSGASGRGQTLVEWIACARTIAEGDVVTVRQSTAGRVTVSFEVREWIKPSQGARRITLDVVDPTEAGVREPWREGQHLLIVVPQRRDQETDTFRGEQLTWYRGRIEQGLPEAETAQCPPLWRDARG